MCMKKLFEKNIFDKFTAFLTRPIFDYCTFQLMGNNAYFVKTFKYIHLILGRYVSDIIRCA